MSKMRDGDDTEILEAYLQCKRKRNKPRVHHEVCETKCSEIELCVSYHDWCILNGLETISLDTAKKYKPKKKKVKPKKRKIRRKKN